MWSITEIYVSNLVWATPFYKKRRFFEHLMQIAAKRVRDWIGFHVAPWTILFRACAFWTTQRSCYISVYNGCHSIRSETISYLHLPRKRHSLCKISDGIYCQRAHSPHVSQWRWSNDQTQESFFQRNHWSHRSNHFHKVFLNSATLNGDNAQFWSSDESNGTWLIFRI